MADITITAANVADYQGGRLRRNMTAGETITAGQTCYRKRTDNRAWLAQSDGTEAQAECVGIAASSVSAGQPLDLWNGGDIAIGGTCVAGTTYYLSTTFGGITDTVPTSAKYVTIIGVGKGSGVLSIGLFRARVQVP